MVRGMGSRVGEGHPGQGSLLSGDGSSTLLFALCSLLGRAAPGGSRGAVPDPGGISPAPGAAAPAPLSRSRPLSLPEKETAQRFPAQSPTWKSPERISHPAPGSWGWRGKRWGMGEDQLSSRI